MLPEKQVETVETDAENTPEQRLQELAAFAKKANPALNAEQDLAWSKENLRWADGKVILDMANVVRVVDRHEEFQGRFKYDETLRRVLDKGSVMLDWRVSEACVKLQERFLPGIPEAIVLNALVVVANWNNAK